MKKTMKYIITLIACIPYLNYTKQPNIRELLQTQEEVIKQLQQNVQNKQKAFNVSNATQLTAMSLGALGTYKKYLPEKIQPKNFKEFKDWAQQEDPEAAVRAETAQRETVKKLKQERRLSPEASTVDPNKLLADKKSLGDTILRLGIRETLPNGVEYAVLVTPSHERLTASRTKSGQVIRLGLERKLADGVETTEFHSGDLADKTGGLNEFLTVQKTNREAVMRGDTEGRSSGLMVQIGTSEVNLGQVVGNEWEPDTENGGMSRPNLTRDNSDAALSAAIGNIAAAVDAVVQDTAQV